jgi:hypothetical protein
VFQYRFVGYLACILTCFFLLYLLSVLLHKAVWTVLFTDDCEVLISGFTYVSVLLRLLVDGVSRYDLWVCGNLYDGLGFEHENMRVCPRS